MVVNICDQVPPRIVPFNHKKSQTSGMRITKNHRKSQKITENHKKSQNPECESQKITKNHRKSQNPECAAFSGSVIVHNRVSSCVIVRYRASSLWCTFLGGNWGVSQPITLHLPQLVSSVTHDNNTTGFNRDDPIFRVFSAGDRFFSRASRVFFV